MNKEQARAGAIELTKIALEEIKAEIAEFEKDLCGDDDGRSKFASLRILSTLNFLKTELLIKVLDHMKDLMKQGHKE